MTPAAEPHLPSPSPAVPAAHPGALPWAMAAALAATVGWAARLVRPQEGQPRWLVGFGMYVATVCRFRGVIRNWTMAAEL